MPLTWETPTIYDPISDIEVALEKARSKIVKMRPDNHGTVVAAHESVVRVGELVVTALRAIERRRALDP